MRYHRIHNFIGRHKIPKIYVDNIKQRLYRHDEYYDLLEETKKVNDLNQTKAIDEFNILLADYTRTEVEYKELIKEHHRMYYIEPPQKPILELSSLPSNYFDLRRTDKKRANRAKIDRDKILEAEHDAKLLEWRKELSNYESNQKELLILYPEPIHPRPPVFINPPRIMIQSMPGWKPYYEANIEIDNKILSYFDTIIFQLDTKSKFKAKDMIEIPPEYYEIFDLLKNCGYDVSIKSKDTEVIHHYSEGEGYNHREYTVSEYEICHKIKIKLKVNQCQDENHIMKQILKLITKYYHILMRSFFNWIPSLSSMIR